jgi:hypothetical protein
MPGSPDPALGVCAGPYRKGIHAFKPRGELPILVHSINDDVPPIW